MVYFSIELQNPKDLPTLVHATPFEPSHIFTSQLALVYKLSEKNVEILLKAVMATNISHFSTHQLKMKPKNMP